MNSGPFRKRVGSSVDLGGLAAQEADRGIAATYFILPNSMYYNILTPTARQLLNKKVQAFEIEAANTSMHQAQAWLKTS